MPTESPPLKRGERGWKAATFVIFVGTGITYASWVTRTPAIRSSLGVGTGGMGLIILGLSIGSMAGLLLAGPVVARVGARHVITAAATIASLGLLTVGLGSGFAIAALVGLGLALTGAGFGMCEVALNVEGAAIEKRMGRSFLPSLHGAFSLGTLAGAGLGRSPNCSTSRCPCISGCSPPSSWWRAEVSWLCCRRRPDETSRAHARDRVRPRTRRSGGTPGSSCSD